MKEIYQAFLQSKGVQTDTRKLQPGEIFIALKGERVDANELVEEALNKGAFKVITSNKAYASNPNCFVVDNTLQTLQELATYHRRQLSIPVIGITGTNGKTTTKELISTVLSSTYRCHFTPLNLNNHIGVPLTILQLNSSHQIAVIEMGANHPGEIKQLCEIAQPTHGIITNIGKAHLEGFGSFENIIHTKKALYDWIQQSQGVVFVHAEDPLLMNLSTSLQRILYSRQAFNVEVTHQFPLTFSWVINDKKYVVASQLFGQYNLPNFLCAISVGLHFNISPEMISEKLSSYKNDMMRSQLVQTASNHLILDAYNANPTSMKKALEEFISIPSKNKVVILGEMLELGTYSLKEHKHILDFLATQSFSHVFLVGKAFLHFKEQYSHFLFFSNTAELSTYLEKNPLKGQIILMKGSRGNKLEQVIRWL